MNLSEIKEELIENLRATTETEILAGKLEKVFIPWLLEKTNSSDKNIEEALEEQRKIISHNFMQFLKLSEVNKSIDRFSEGQKYLSDLNLKISVIDEVQDLIHWRDFRDYTKDYMHNQDEVKRSLSKLASNFKPELDEIFDSSNIEKFCKEKKAEISSEIESLKKSIESFPREIQKSFMILRDKNEEVNLLANEENALRFFYRIMLDKELRNNYVEIQSIRFYLKENSNQSELPLSHYLKPKQNILPKNWRKCLNKMLSEKIPNFSGEKKNWKFVKGANKLSSIDYSYLLALKSALNYQEEIMTEDNEIFLALSGGMMSKICFQEKASFIETFQEKEVEIYYQINHHSDSQTLYSYVSIKYPNKWILLTKEFVIEIGFESAPILFGNASIAEVATAKQIEDIEEEERSAREREDEENEKSRRRFY